MKIIVTGHAGFIGSHLCRALLEAGHEVIGIDNFNDTLGGRTAEQTLNEKHIHLGLSGVERDRMSLYTADIRNDDIKELFSDVDVVYHLAAQASLSKSFDYPLEYQSVNVEGTNNILEFCREASVKRVIFASDASVLGSDTTFPSLRPRPESVFAMTKMSGELLGRTYNTNFGIEFISLRLFNVYGPRSRCDMVMSKFIESAIEQIPVKGLCYGGSVRDYIYITDCVDALSAALDIKLPVSGYEYIDVGTGKSTKLFNLRCCIEKNVGKNILLDAGDPDYGYPKGVMSYSVANPLKAEELLEWRPKVTLDVGIARQVAYMKLAQILKLSNT